MSHGESGSGERNPVCSKGRHTAGAVKTRRAADVSWGPRRPAPHGRSSDRGPAPRSVGAARCGNTEVAEPPETPQATNARRRARWAWGAGPAGRAARRLPHSCPEAHVPRPGRPRPGLAGALATLAAPPTRASPAAQPPTAAQPARLKEFRGEHSSPGAEAGVLDAAAEPRSWARTARGVPRAGRRGHQAGPAGSSAARVQLSGASSL